MNVTNYPLHWPDHVARKPPSARRPGRFNKKQHNGRWVETKDISVADAIGRLQTELDMIGGRYPVVSTNLEVRLDGLPRSGQREPSDPGVAVWFYLPGHDEQTCLPCDTFTTVAQNIAAVAAHMARVRDIERYGVASIDQMFSAFEALPAPGETRKRHWREVLNLDGNPTAERIQAQFRSLSRERHPDAGGSSESFHELQQARDEALREISQ